MNRMPVSDLIQPPHIDGVKDKAVVATVRRAGFTKFTPQLLSSTRNPKSGVCLQPGAGDAIILEYPEARPDAPQSRRKKKKDSRRDLRCVQFRTKGEIINESQAYLELEGYKYPSEKSKALYLDWVYLCRIRERMTF